MDRNIERLMTADDDAIITLTLTDMVAGALVRKQLRSIFDYARVTCDDVQVYENKSWIESSFNVKIKGKVKHARRVYSMIQNLAS